MPTCSKVVNAWRKRMMMSYGTSDGGTAWAAGMGGKDYLKVERKV